MRNRLCLEISFNDRGPPVTNRRTPMVTGWRAGGFAGDLRREVSGHIGDDTEAGP